MIPLFKVHMPQSVDGPLLETLHSGFIGQGPKIEAFEERLRAYFDHPYVLTLNNGTSGLHLALRLAGVGHGDEVVTTAMTCTATNMPILERGGRIVWADVDPVTGLIDPDDIARKITPRTKAVMVVHFGGIPCDMDRINALAQSRGIKVIEDAAHGFGSEYRGTRVGRHSDFVMFSLQAIKHITTVDGGLLLTKTAADYKRGKLLRWYGIDRETKRADFRCEENIEEFGYKMHMNDISAVIGIEQLKYVDEIVAKHRTNQKFYDDHLRDLPGIRLIPARLKEGSAAWLYTLHAEDRPKFMKFMTEQGVMVSRVHERNDLHTAFSPFRTPLPKLDEFNRTQVSIPVGWWVTESDRTKIVEAIRLYARS
jgi:dTDP-4-amino-4,6-dideoxygalactose transaminase